MLFDGSVAENRLVVVPIGKVEPLDKPTKLAIKVQLSVAYTVKVTGAPQIPEAILTVMLLGQVTSGFTSFLTVTVKLQGVELPEASVATNVLVVVPSGKNDPLAKPAVCDSVKAQLSDAVIPYSGIV